MEIIKPGTHFDFVGKRYWAYALSAVTIVVSLLSVLFHGGLTYGVDFSGGIMAQVRFTVDTTPAEVKTALAPLGMQDSVVQSFGNVQNEFLIRSERTDITLEGLGDRLREALAAKYGQDGVEMRRVETVGPKVGGDLRRKALLAIYFSMLFMAVYISGRFEHKWGLAGVMAAVLVGATLLVQVILGEGAGITPLIITALVVTLAACVFLRLRYALGATVALIHDVIVTVGVFSLLGKEFDLTTVAAILTIIGYSVNDTIIVYDRIRENIKKDPKRPLWEIINASVNQTLSRTILTSGTTLLVVVCLWLLGGGVIEDFAFALLVGIGTGTYSSVYVASPILIALPASRKAAAPAVPAKPAPAQVQAPAPVAAPEASQAPREAAPATPRPKSAAKTAAARKRSARKSGGRSH